MEMQLSKFIRKWKWAAAYSRSIGWIHETYLNGVSVVHDFHLAQRIRYDNERHVTHRDCISCRYINRTLFFNRFRTFGIVFVPNFRRSWRDVNFMLELARDHMR